MIVVAERLPLLLFSQILICTWTLPILVFVSVFYIPVGCKKQIMKCQYQTCKLCPSCVYFLVSTTAEMGNCVRIRLSFKFYKIRSKLNKFEDGVTCYWRAFSVIVFESYQIPAFCCCLFKVLCCCELL